MDDILRRFAALSAPSHPLPDPHLNSSEDLEVPKQNVQVANAAIRAKEEDDELDRIANGIGPSRLVPIRVDDEREREKEERDDIARRMARLTGRKQSDGESDDERDIDVEDYLSSFANTSTENINHPDQDHDPSLSAHEDLPHSKVKRDADENVQDLEREAREALRRVAPFVHLPVGKHDTLDEQMPTTDPLEADDGEDHEETEEEIMTRALEEANLDKLHDPVDVQDDNEDEGGDIGFSFPTIPNHVPVDEVEGDDEVDEETQRRLNILFGLKPSSAAPTTSKQPPAGSNTAGQKKFDFPGYTTSRDDDVDSWCCICNSDATLICIDCDDDLYCDECWRDGHGLGDGKEKGHKVKRFNWSGTKKTLSAI